jgi:hypothetical protein
MFALVRSMKLQCLAVAVVYTCAVLTTLVPARTVAAEEPKLWDLEAKERSPITLHVIAPTKEVIASVPERNLPGVTTFDVRAIAEKVLRERTDFTVRLFEDAAISRCDSRSDKLTCFVEQVWDYDPSSSKLKDEDGRYKRFGEVIDALKADQPKSSFLVVISSIGQPDGSSRLTPVLLDTNGALLLIHEAVVNGKYEKPADRDELEGKISQFSIKASPPPKRVLHESIDPYLRELFLETFRPYFEQSGNWEPFGEIELQVAESGLVIEIDNNTIGQTKAGRTVIGQVRPGERTVRLTLPGYLPAQSQVKVEAQKRSVLAMHVDKLPNEVAKAANKALLWGGVAVAVVGAAITGYALKEALSPGQRVICLHPEGSTEGCGSAEFVRFGAKSKDDPPSLTVNPNGRGLPIAPLGYSLALAGTAWFMSSALFAEDDSLPIVEFVAGAATFLAAFILSIELNGSNCVGQVSCGSKH